jgi:hypothetical protein
VHLIVLYITLNTVIQKESIFANQKAGNTTYDPYGIGLSREVIGDAKTFMHTWMKQNEDV